MSWVIIKPWGKNETTTGESNNVIPRNDADALISELSLTIVIGVMVKCNTSDNDEIIEIDHVTLPLMSLLQGIKNFNIKWEKENPVIGVRDINNNKTTMVSGTNGMK